ncbi:MAG: peptidoglycan-binding protein [Betaproteobacteria bacterium]|nr:peptidoglycan-binding protein [Betaproteobacteria bacterium]
MATQQITGSVGFCGKNSPADVGKVQTLLKSKGLYTGRVDNICGSKTIAAIKDFQANFMGTPDGRIDPNGVTWKKLTGKLPMVVIQPARSALGTIPDFSFPLSFKPISWHEGSRKFGSGRIGTTRLHGGCDLYAPFREPIYAVADGVLARGPYDFEVVKDDPSQVQALEIRHGDLLVRYCEIRPTSFTGTIKKGQKLAEVGLIKFPSGRILHMLHIEIYTNVRLTGPLSVKGAGLYGRRVDVTNPAPYLDVWVNNLPQP